MRKISEDLALDFEVDVHAGLGLIEGLLVLLLARETGVCDRRHSFHTSRYFIFLDDGETLPVSSDSTRLRRVQRCCT